MKFRCERGDSPESNYIDVIRITSFDKRNDIEPSANTMIQKIITLATHTLCFPDKLTELLCIDPNLYQLIGVVVTTNPAVYAIYRDLTGEEMYIHYTRIPSEYLDYDRYEGTIDHRNIRAGVLHGLPYRCDMLAWSGYDEKLTKQEIKFFNTHCGSAFRVQGFIRIYPAHLGAGEVQRC